MSNSLARRDPRVTPVRVETTSELAPPSARDLLLVFFRRWRLFAGWSLGVVSLTCLFLIASPDVYEVSAAILVKKNRAELPVNATDADQRVSVEQVRLEELNSELEILDSQGVLTDVARDLGAEGWVRRSPSRWPHSWLFALESWVQSFSSTPPLDREVLTLDDELRFAPVAQSNIIEIRHRSTDPERGVRAVERLIERYVESRTRVHQVPAVEPFFEGQMTQSQERLLSAQQALNTLLDEAGVTTIDDSAETDPLGLQKTSTLENLSAFESQLASARVAVAASERRVATLNDMMATEPERFASADREHQDVAVEQIRLRLAELRLERDQLRQTFKSSSRAMVNITNQIQLAEAQLAAATDRASRFAETEPNPVYQDLRRQALTARADLQGARRRVAALEGSVGEFQAQLDRLTSWSFELADLQREKEIAEDAYLLYRSKHEEARISTAMDQAKMLNVSVARAPLRPLEPIGPQRVRNALIALIVGIVGGIALVILRTGLDPTFVTGDQLERRLGIGHLASIPELPSQSGRTG